MKNLFPFYLQRKIMTTALFLLFFSFTMRLVAQDNFPGNTLDFDGGEYVYIPYDASLNPSEFTIMFWAKADGGENETRSIITSRTTTAGYMFYATADNHWEFWTRDGSTISNKIEGPIVEFNKWMFIAGTFANDTMRMYVNGEMVGELSGVSYVPNPSKRTRIAAGKTESGTADYFFKGKIDEVALFSSALSVETIREYQHLTHNDTDNNIESYWQFNENSGTELPDNVGSNDGDLINLEPADWVSSTVPTGYGASVSQVESLGIVSFPNTNLGMDFSVQNGADVSVTRISNPPNTTTNVEGQPYNGQYWVLHRYGSGTYVADLSFSVFEGLSEDEASNFESFKLYTRTANSNGSWTYLTTASAADASNDEITFEDISAVGQFMIGRTPKPEIKISPLSLDFEEVCIGDSLTMNLSISNAGQETLTISNISTDHSAFTVNISSCDILAGESQNIEVKFKPQTQVNFANTLSISSNDENEPLSTVSLLGETLSPYMNTLHLPLNTNLLSSNFNGIDVGTRSVPSSTDLDGDGLIDLIIGGENGLLAHYEQDSENSLDFSLITSSFNGINVGENSSPAFTDIDGDGLLDLIVGLASGNLHRYEQDSENSLTFSLITTHFNNIDYNNPPNPSFTDLDGDGLIDMIIGEYNGRLHHYEQSSPNSIAFNLVTYPFNNIDVGSASTPSFTDLDEDGLLDLMVGEYSGNLNHYEQVSENSLTFSLITDSYSDIDVGTAATPNFMDIDGDHLLDLLIGNQDGIINHYEQQAIDSLDFGKVLVGNNKLMKYYVRANCITGNMDIYSNNSHLMISLSENSVFSQSLSLTPTNHHINDTIYVQFSPDELISYEGNIMHTSDYMDTTYVTLIGEGTRVDNFAGNALDFDGNNDYVNCGKIAAITASNPRTIEAWAYAEDFNNGAIFSTGYPNSNIGFSLRTTNVDNLWYMQLGDIAFGVTLPNSKNQWHHYAMTYDGAIAKLYYDGKLMEEHSLVLNTSVTDFFIGKWNSYVFDGKIDEVRVWEIALDSTQIRENMHLALQGDEAGLVSYWQFNENTGNSLNDIISGHHGILTNMENNDWVSSTIPFGGGESNTQVEANATVDFTNTDIQIDYSLQNGASVCVSRIDTLSNLIPDNMDSVFTQQYWVINRYGSGNFEANLHFTTTEDLTLEDQNTPQAIRLYTRESNSDESWTSLQMADSVNASLNLAIFNGINDFSQFIVGRVNTPRISLSTSTLDFTKVAIDDSLNMSYIISNIGGDSLFINMSNNNAAFSILSPTIDTVLAGESIAVEVRFKPLDNLLYQDVISITSNAKYNPLLNVQVSGEGLRSQYDLLAYPFDYDLLTDNFAGLDFGQYSRPCFEDIDNDGLMDILLGDESGQIVHYEELTAGVSDFAYVTDNFNSINVGSFSMPTITDIDGNGLLDLIVGKYNGRISRYEQNSTNSNTFDYKTNYFNSIDVGARSCPTFTDINGNGLLDLVVGEYNGNLNTYRQTSENSLSFTSYSCSMNSIDVGYRSTPFYMDLDGDDLLDLIIGESSGRLNHYEQQYPNSYSFSLVNSEVNSIDVGTRSMPFILDIDEDRLYDLLVGEEDGHLFHYEQKTADNIDFGRSITEIPITKEYYLRADGIIGDFELQCAGQYFTISESENSGFAQTLSITPTNDKISKIIYIRFAPTAEIAYLDSIRHTANQVDTTYLVLSGEGIVIDPFAGNTLDFDGGEYVNCGRGPELSASQSGTIEMWAKVESFDGAGLFTGIDDNGLDFSVKTSNTDNVWRVQFLEGYNEVTLPHSINEWHHYCLTYNGNTARFYYDGELVDNFNIDLNSGQYDIWLARWRGHYLKGKIDEARIWEISLNAYEIREQMHLVLQGSEYGLRSYYQFNEDSGAILPDLLSNSDATLINMENSDWESSSLAIGGGESDTQTEANGIVNFTNTSLQLNYTSQNAATITASRIDSIPNLYPSNVDSIFASQYWAIHRYGSGSFDADITFSIDEDLSLEDENNPTQIELYTRGSTADTAWAYLASAHTVDAANNTATFNNITGFSQFILVRNGRINVNLSVLLEGAFNGTEQDTTLNNLGLLPISQPFNTIPWNYSGTETVVSIPRTDIVDWVLIELRDTTDATLATPETVIARQAAFLLSNGEIVDMDGNGAFPITTSISNNLFVVVYHRNHLPIMSANAVSESAGVYTYDFTTAITQAYLSGEKLLNGRAVMIGGDINADRSINNTDINLWKTEAGTKGYETADTKMDGEVDNKDKNDIWSNNNNSSSTVPE